MDLARHKSSQKWLGLDSYDIDSYDIVLFNIDDEGGAEIAGQAERQAEIFVNFEIAYNKYSIVWIN